MNAAKPKKRKKLEKLFMQYKQYLREADKALWRLGIQWGLEAIEEKTKGSKLTNATWEVNVLIKGMNQTREPRS